MKGKKYPCYIGANRFHTLGGVHIECMPCPINGQCPPSIINSFGAHFFTEDDYEPYLFFAEFWALFDTHLTDDEIAEIQLAWEKLSVCVVESGPKGEK